MTLSLEDIEVTSFDTGTAEGCYTTSVTPDSPIPYSPYCCTEENSGCDTNVEAGCPGGTTIAVA
ncbi:MAG TPA: hypothetical protein VF771_00655 [Longimicrobiaceae bacterium]